MRLYNAERGLMHRAGGRFSAWTFVQALRTNSSRPAPSGEPGSSTPQATNVSHHSAEIRRAWQAFRVQPEAIAGGWCAPRRIGRYRTSCLPFGGLSGRNHIETWAGCIVSLITPARSLFSVSRSVPSRSLAEKASRVFLASYFLR